MASRSFSLQLLVPGTSSCLDPVYKLKVMENNEVGEDAKSRKGKEQRVFNSAKCFRQDK